MSNCMSPSSVLVPESSCSIKVHVHMQNAHSLSQRRVIQNTASATVKHRIDVMIAIFSHPVYITSHLEFCYCSGAQKNRMMPIPNCQKSLTIC